MTFSADIDCPHCTAVFPVKLHEGDQGSCPKCGAKFFIDSIGLDHDWCFPSWENQPIQATNHETSN